MDLLARAVMVAYCGWDPTTVTRDVTAKLDGNGTTLLTLPSLYVTDVTDVTVTLSDGSTYAASIGAGSDVEWNAGGELLWRPWAGSCLSAWPDGKANISVTYTSGYASQPADLAAALASVSCRMPTMQSGVTRAKLGTADLTYASSVAEGGLLLVESMVFDKYRIVRVS